MPTTRLKVVQPRRLQDGKTAWHEIGVAFAWTGKGIHVLLRSMPLPQLSQDGKEIECAFWLFKDREKDNGGTRQPPSEPLMPVPNIEQPPVSTMSTEGKREEVEPTPF